MNLFDKIESTLDFDYRYTGYSNYIWCIDNGHGEYTPGKRFENFREYEFNRHIARMVCKKLRDANISYFLVVPEDNVDNFLSGRVARANSVKGEKIFVSIHSNAGPGQTTTAHGIECLYSGTSMSRRISEAFQRGLVEDLGWLDRGVKTDVEASGNKLTVLRKTKMPATLLEIGFYNNPSEKALLMRPDVRNKIAESIFKTIIKIEQW